MSRAGFDDKAAKRLEAIYGTPDVAAQRRRVVVALQPKAGERIADLGCGPGYLAVELAEAVGPSGAVDGIDVASDMVAIAKERAAAHPNCRIEVGDACRLPFADASFDAVASIQVLEHIEAVGDAIAEMWRVLRTGGRAAVMATDWDGLVCETEDRTRLRRMIASWSAHGPHPHLPSRLAPLLEVGGLGVEQVEAVPMLSMRAAAGTYAFGMFDLLYRFARKQGDAEAEAFIREQRALGEAGRFFFCLNRFLFLARKT